MANWWLDELVHAGREHLDSRYVDGYEAKAGYDPTDDLAILRRHGLAAMMKPGGILRLRDLVYDFEPSQAAAFVASWLAGAVDDPAKGWTADELAEHVRIEHSSYSWLFEPILERTGFEILDREYVRSAYGAFTCRRR